VKDLCHKCRKNVVVSGKYCDLCKERGREYTARMRQLRKDRGLCIVCGSRSAMDGVSYCSDCASKCVESVTNLRLERDMAGICIICGKRPQFGGNKSCKKCTKIINSRYHSKKDI